MGRYAVFISGPAGSGKSTLCSALLTHLTTLGRNAHLVNLDPAAEHFVHTPTIDVRELISLSDVQSELGLGPNGGLVYCFEYLLENLDWLEEQLGSYEDDYLVVDCPGQIELYTHTPLVQRILGFLGVNHSFRLCQLYLLESHFVDVSRRPVVGCRLRSASCSPRLPPLRCAPPHQDVTKFFAGTLSAMSAMINLEVPWINVLSKVDLLTSGAVGSTSNPSASAAGTSLAARRNLERYLDPDPLLLASHANASTNPRLHALNAAVVRLVDDFSVVHFLPSDANDEGSVATLLSHIDHAMQYGEDEEPKEPRDMERFEGDDDDERGGGGMGDEEREFEELLSGRGAMGAGGIEI